MSDYLYGVLPTPLGWIGVLASKRGIRRLTLPQASPQQAIERLGPEAAEAILDHLPFEELRLRLEQLFAGEPVNFDDELDLNEGSSFFYRAWQACRSVPRGETRSYAWLAAQAGNPRALRAAGQAMARNPVTIIIPCHRIISTNGSLCGYGGGIELKQRLLNLERTVPL